MTDYWPAVITIGITEFQHGLGRCWRELGAGGVIHVMHKRSRLHRAWLVPDPPDGETPVPIGCNELRGSLGPVLDQVRDGVVFQVRDEKNGRPVTRGYLMMHPPEGIARLDAVLQFAVRGPDRPDPAEGHLAAGDGGAAVMDPELERVASVAWVLTLLRNHGDWSDAMVASVTGADEAEVRQVRAELESWDAQCREPR